MNSSEHRQVLDCASPLALSAMPSRVPKRQRTGAVQNANAANCNPAVAQLCPQCALCCNGVLFKDVELQPGDDAKELQAQGLPISKLRVQKFPQPCAALHGCHCRIYADRPARCRQFECALLKSVAAGAMEVASALRVIRDARQRANKVRDLLRELGNVDEHIALSLRFKKTKRKLESAPPDDATAETFSRLTLAVHDLNLLLRAKFYP